MARLLYIYMFYISDISYKTWRDKLHDEQSKDKQTKYINKKAEIGLAQKRLTSTANKWKKNIKHKFILTYYEKKTPME